MELKWRLAFSIFIFGAIVAWINSALPFAAGDQPKVVQTKLFMSKDGVHPGETVALALKLAIAPGWHINAPEQVDIFLIPCSFEVSESSEYRLIDKYYPPAERGKFSFSENELAFYAGEIYLGVLLEISARAKPGKIKINSSFTYQACDDRSCLPPETILLEVEIDVVPFEKSTKEINSEIFAHMNFKKGKEI
ncbi:MAG: protein-disulfide reductase DsbD N-terminal domain-containing protein [Candidatus Aminicenantes bacterium]|nr:protein-disulfide reductase DsbD N-terminal domain-containing protein [Candidatus Aminicenantes bacterium]